MNDEVHRRKVTLKSGAGEIALYTDGVNVLTLSAEDRAFLFGIIDKIDDYERQQ